MDIFTAENFSKETLSALAAYVTAGGKQVCLAPGCPLGKPPFDLPEDVMVQDVRYGGVSFIRGNHPRLEGLWTQYSHLDTGLARNITFSQTITDRTPIENWQSKPHAMQAAPVGAMVSEEYRHAHNHYQLLHSEVYNFSRDLNGVAIWGDSAALAPNAKSWGAFFSARSWPLKWTGYTPPECFDYDDQADFDAALVGVEIDVLNAGKDWCDFNGYTPPGTMGKVGLQVVGFGKRNTAAIEIRTEDSDDGSRSPGERRGTWHWGIIVRNALGHRSTVLMAENGEIFRGIDLDKTVCTDGALRISGAGPATGVIFDGGESGEVFSTPNDNALNIRIGAGGLKIWSADGARVICIIDENGLWLGDRESSARR